MKKMKDVRTSTVLSNRTIMHIYLESQMTSELRSFVNKYSTSRMDQSSLIPVPYGNDSDNYFPDRESAD